MLNKSFPLMLVVAMAAFVGCDSQSPMEKKIAPATELQAANVGGVDIKKVSEALGHFIGRNLNAPGISFDMDSVVQGIKEGAAGKPAPMNEQDYEKAMAELQQQAFAAMSEKNMDAANAFMKKNLQASGVVEVIPGKLQYMIVEQGKGDAVPEHGTPLINYTGKYEDGTTFGSSEAAGGPISVPIDQTIPGFSKGVAGMKEGEKRRLYVHPDMGYGTTGQLPPNSLLIFDIEVVKAESPEKETADAFQAKIDEDLSDDGDDADDKSFDVQNDKDNAKKEAAPEKPKVAVQPKAAVEPKVVAQPKADAQPKVAPQPKVTVQPKAAE